MMSHAASSLMPVLVITATSVVESHAQTPGAAPAGDPQITDCNNNGVEDAEDIASGFSLDCNASGIPDECELTDHDCCEAGHGAGCSDPDITSCVCRDDPHCCEVEWDRLCASEVVTLACGVCYPNDCNANEVPDDCDIRDRGDCNENGVPDDCDAVVNEASPDCDGDAYPDECRISVDSIAPGGPFFCTQDCDPDCNDNGVLDACERDCNRNQIPDECDIRDGTSGDCNFDMVPDECQGDDDGDGVPNPCDECPDTPPGAPIRENGCVQQGACCLSSGFCEEDLPSDICIIVGGRFLGDKLGCHSDPDVDMFFGCDDGCPLDGAKTEPGLCGCGVSDDGVISPGTDCNDNSARDRCEVNAGLDSDCNENLILDSCDLDHLASDDCNENAIPDECEIRFDSGAGGGPFFCVVDCDPDCNVNGIPDRCDVAADSEDCDENGVPDECQLDSDGDGIPDACDPCFGDNDLEGLPCDNPADPDPCRTGTLDCSSGTLVCTDDLLGDDQDADGVFDCFDVCPDTPLDSEVDENGCPPEGTCCFIGVDQQPSFVCYRTLAFCNAIGGAWQGNGSPCPAFVDECHFPADGDCDFDRDFDFDDFALVDHCVAQFLNEEPAASCRCADLSGDGILSLLDLGAVQISWMLERLCPVSATGHCCDPRGLFEPGCEPKACCEAVCELDPSCCQWRWTKDCAAIARLTEVCRCAPVACCLEDGEPRCEDVFPVQCRDRGGFPLTLETTCDIDGGVCVGECPEGALDDCCNRNGLGRPGCGDTNCCEAVCRLDPSCCYDTWTAECSRIALTTADDACVCPSEACCLVEERICMDLTPELCSDNNGFSLGPDTTCEANPDRCLDPCPPDPASSGCCDPAGLDGPGCGEPSCCTAVCLREPSCCLDKWGPQCAFRALEFPEECTTCPRVACCADDNSCRDVTERRCLLDGEYPQPEGSTCGQVDVCLIECPFNPPPTAACCNTIEPSRVGGCTDPFCCDAVCAIKRSCCEDAWTLECSQIAAEVVPDECRRLYPPVCHIYACCLPGGECVETSPTLCLNWYGGTLPDPPEGSNCDDDNHNGIADVCEATCPPDAAGDCCDPDGLPTPGCASGVCCDAVCAIDSSCCTNEWSHACAVIAAGLVDECHCPDTACCFDGGATCVDQPAASCVADGGQPREGIFCQGDIDPQNGIDDACEVCGPGAGDCCSITEPNNTPGCEDPVCCAIICDPVEGLPECCEVAWDYWCALDARDLCTVCICGPDAGDCCPWGVENRTPGCYDHDCCARVCALRPACCYGSWDGNGCDDLAQTECAICDW